MSILTPKAELYSKLNRRTSPVSTFTSKHINIVVGSCIIAVILVLAVFAGLFAAESPLQVNVDDQLIPPGREHVFGTDMMGRSVFARVLYGGRISLLVGIAVTFVSGGIGFFIGMIAGFSRWFDRIIMRIMDGLMAIPGILLAIALMSVTRPSVGNVILAVSIPFIPRVARLIRSLVLSLRERLFVESAFSSGANVMRVIFVHLLPSTLPPLAVQTTYIFARAIVTESYLSFLGAGTPPDIPSWGGIMAEGRITFISAPWMVLIPGLFIAITVLAMNIVGDGLRDWIDPRMKREIRG